MLPDDPRHGTRQQPRTETVPGCSCDSCEESRTYRRRIYKQARMGKPRRVSTRLAVKHTQALIAQGWTIRGIASMSGVGAATISEAHSGIAQKMTVDNVAAILGVSGTPNTDRVPAHGTIRRLRALVALGWTSQEVCLEAGLSPRFLPDCAGRDQATVTTATAKAVAALYERLSMSVPELTPNRKRSRTMALKSGWAPPLAWDNIDDPREKPRGAIATVRSTYRPHDDIDPAVIDRLLDGEPIREATNAERKEAMRRWLAMGNSERSLCRALGWKDGRYLPRKVEASAWPALLVVGYWKALTERDEVAA